METAKSYRKTSHNGQFTTQSQSMQEIIISKMPHPKKLSYFQWHAHELQMGVVKQNIDRSTIRSTIIKLSSTSIVDYSDVMPIIL